VLDNVVRFIGQKVAAVIAETEAAAEEGCRRLDVGYEILPAVVDPTAAITPGAPVIHGDKTPANRVANAGRNIVAETHGEFGDVASALAQAAVTYEVLSRPSGSSMRRWKPMAALPGSMPMNPQCPLQHAGAIPDAAHVDRPLPSPPDKVRVFCERVGGGFGGKQEMFVEDILALAALKTAAPSNSN